MPSPRTLARLLETPVPDRRPLIYRIEEVVPTDTIIETIKIAGELSREILVRVLGERPEAEVAVAISDLLSDPSPDVRGQAAHVIEVAGATPFPERLLEAARSEPDPDARMHELWALAKTRMVGALPWVTALSMDPNVDDDTRTHAAKVAKILRDLESE